ncbi:hypothetical protein [Hymenobacter latericus]|uniref:hypothetical protein n=1 Tax=Hymenobacter sp. YIM 151858-1 TaxID=2987688 RepID=UPI00222617E6|nr:hypothetical protein [Hymenobacter sp. YIM 151858-1]UYZ60126.1 hypothetical protein OIS50_04820 [Hymenobacter sp. YIM 151858-1]
MADNFIEIKPDDPLFVRPAGVPIAENEGVILTNAAGTPTYIDDISELRKVIAPAPIIKAAAPTSADPGKPGQMYYHQQGTGKTSVYTFTGQGATGWQLIVEIGALSAAVFTATKSFTAVCGEGTTGASVTREATRTSTQDQADADKLALQAAKEAATALLVCTPVVNTSPITVGLQASASALSDGQSLSLTPTFDLAPGTAVTVEFFNTQNGVPSKVGETNGDVLTLTPPVGNHAYTAKVTAGPRTGTSPARNVTVSAVNAAPSGATLQLSTPSTYVGTSVTATVNGTDDKGLTKAELYEGNVKVAESTTLTASGFALTYTPAATGTKALKGRVYDQQGLFAETAVQNLGVQPAPLSFDTIIDENTAGAVVYGQSFQAEFKSLVFSANIGTKLRLNAADVVGGDPAFAVMAPSVSGAQIGQVSLHPNTLGKPCAFVHNGQTYVTTFQNTPDGQFTSIG